ncbi:MAG: hypothetical protein KatS3mg010_1150 [Acidimicrobiia bacterium]|nr:MAG: hypothetical protein KatS3mg010_1150 [Acidimicrobiia bacterium]
MTRAATGSCGPATTRSADRALRPGDRGTRATAPARRRPRAAPRPAAANARGAPQRVARTPPRWARRIAELGRDRCARPARSARARSQPCTTRSKEANRSIPLGERRAARSSRRIPAAADAGVVEVGLHRGARREERGRAGRRPPTGAPATRDRRASGTWPACRPRGGRGRGRSSPHTAWGRPSDRAGPPRPILGERGRQAAVSVGDLAHSLPNSTRRALAGDLRRGLAPRPRTDDLVRHGRGGRVEARRTHVAREALERRPPEVRRTARQGDRECPPWRSPPR